MQEDNNFHYEAGSIETLKKMVETKNGLTILPELALQDLSAQQLKMVRHFKAPVPVREVSLVTHRNFVEETASGCATSGDPPGSTAGNAT